jgi:hypothetical protein
MQNIKICSVVIMKPEARSEMNKTDGKWSLIPYCVQKVHFECLVSAEFLMATNVRLK